MAGVCTPPHQPAPPASRNLPWFRASDVAEEPPIPREWLVEGLIPGAKVTLLSGDGGTGKSLLALQLAVAVAMGTGWLGRSVTHGTTLFISAEDDRNELHRRLVGRVRATADDRDWLDRLTMLSMAGEDALLANLDRMTGVLQPTELYRALDARMDNESPTLVVLGTLADLFPGNENDRTQARHFVGLLRRLAIRHDCAIVLLSDPSLSGLNGGSGMSGSTAWSNSVRSRLYLERIVSNGHEADPDARVLRTKKANYGRVGGETSLIWRDGVFVADPARTGLDRLAAKAKAARVFLSLLRIFNEQGRKVNHAGAQTYAPSVFSAHPGAEGVTKLAFRSAMEEL